jgi:LysR family tcuABC transcriptional regulator
MEIRQLRTFVRVVELGSMGRAALELELATSTLSMQISQLESELSTRLLHRTSSGVSPTDAGLDFFRQAQLILRQVEAAASISQHGRLTGHVSVGLAATTASIVALPFIETMRQRYPGVRIRIVEGLSGYLESLLGSRQLDLSILFDPATARRWSATTLLNERLFVIGRNDLPGMPRRNTTTIAKLTSMPLILPSGAHTLRTLVLDAFRAAGREPNVSVEIDGVGSLLDAVRGGIGASVQPGSFLTRLTSIATGSATDVRAVQITDAVVQRPSILVSLPDDELTAASLAARAVLTQLVRQLVADGRWAGATLV